MLRYPLGKLVFETDPPRKYPEAPQPLSIKAINHTMEIFPLSLSLDVPDHHHKFA